MGFEMSNTIEVIGSIMGSGKTTALLNWMLQNSHERFIYVTPLLSEIQNRVLEHCAAIGMVELSDSGTRKSEDLLNKLQEGANIAITHKMYQEMNRKHLNYIRELGYILVIDEEVGFVNTLENYTFDDIISLFDRDMFDVDYNNLGKVKFTWEIGEYHKFSKLKNLCDIGCVYGCRNQKEVFVVQLPVELITSAKRVILSTYGYYGSAMHKFMQMRGVQHKDFDEVTLMYSEREIKEKIKGLIQFVSTPSTVKVEEYPLSYSWWSSTKAQDIEKKKSVFKAIASIQKTNKVKSEEFMYTTSKAQSLKRNIRGSALSHDKCFVYSSCRATNEFRHKKFLVHAYNRYPNVQVKKYFLSYGFDFNEDHLATHEMIQWIWRSAIRDQQPIKLCIIPKRMRMLFQKWLDEACENTP